MFYIVRHFCWAGRTGQLTSSLGGRRIGAVIVAGALDLTLMLSDGSELKLWPIPIDSLFT